MAYEPNIVVRDHGYIPPEDPDTGIYVTYAWDADSGVTSQAGGWYQVQRRLADDDNETGWYTGPIYANQDRSFYDLHLANHTEYEFRVRAVYEPAPTSNFSDWSDWFSYTPDENPS